MIPDKIFCDDKDGNEWGIWFNEPAGSTDVAYIRKEALVDWLKRKQDTTLKVVEDDLIQEVIEHINEM